ncbi:MAG: hypothetical protein NZ809_04425 [Thermodesulfovibrio sp.]|nr:hypothetical protein [Thermodesulfovibrio sp.]
MKKITLAIILIFFAIVGVKSLYSTNTFATKKLENTILIAHKEILGELEYGKVLFKHQNHIEALAKIFNKPEEAMCRECHLKDRYGNYLFDFLNINMSDSQKFKQTYHRECLSCHQKLSAQGQKTGPEILLCRGCHKKEYDKLEIQYPFFEFDFALHDKHIRKHNKDCSLCHHIYDVEEKNRELALIYEKGTEQSCYYCHDFTKKRGPELAKVVEVARKRGLNIKKACHLLCLNCHLQNKTLGKDAGPIVCSKCHTEKYKTVSELKDVPRPKMDQPNITLMYIEEAKMKGVSFNHNLHEQSNKTCRGCHHERLKACKECHDLKGKKEGGFVNIITAFHSYSSEISCQGCHRKQINKKECMGCHYFIPSVKTELNKDCSRCHTGEKLKVREINLEKNKIKEEVLIKHLEKDFEPVKMPHYKIIRKLTDISNQSKLATYFHNTLDTICRGCHHKSQDTAVKQKEPPPCVSCHGVEFDVREFSRPRLQAAYHGMCLKCHENMKLEKPKKCTDCHERKLKTNVYN